MIMDDRGLFDFNLATVEFSQMDPHSNETCTLVKSLLKIERGDHLILRDRHGLCELYQLLLIHLGLIRVDDVGADTLLDGRLQLQILHRRVDIIYLLLKVVLLGVDHFNQIEQESENDGVCNSHDNV